MSKSIPKRLNLEFDRKQAKALLADYRAGEPAAAQRFAAFHPGCASAAPKLTDAQLVIAREHGFASWPRWKAFVETRGLGRRRQAEIVLQAICSSDIARARVLLREDPSLAREDFFIACACGEAALVEAELARDPSRARKAGGVNGWEPILYACFSRWLRCDAGRIPGIVAVVRLLLAQGADPNASYMTTWMDEPWKETALFGASGIANHAGLTRLLLEAGADVNEQLPEPDPLDSKVSPWGTEALYHTSEFRDTACLRLLLEARPYPLGVSYCLGRALDFEHPEAAELFLAHGADPNFRIPWMERRTHLHRAAQKGRSARIIRALIEAGADLMATDDTGLTAGQYAVRYGHREIQALLENGMATAGDRAVGAIMEGTASGTCSGLLEADLLCEAARRDDAAAIKRLAAAGADVKACDPGPYGTPPLHWAAWRGRFEAVRALVECGADIHWTNVYGGAALGTAIHGSANCFDLDGGPAMRLPEEALAGDYPRIVEYLIAAGAKLPGKIHGGSEAVQEILRRHGVLDAGAEVSDEA